MSAGVRKLTGESLATCAGIVYMYNLGTMAKQDLHPEYFLEAKVACACGNTFKVGATKPEIRVDICSKCHPFFTGEEKLIDTAGRVERFKARTSKVKPKSVKKARAKK